MSDTWTDDILPGYHQLTLELGQDPDGEGDVVATLVRHPEAAEIAAASGRAVLYVHGFSDYFFNTELADRVTASGYGFFALDLRKCGRSHRPGHTAHYVSDLALYDAELDRALRLMGAREVVVVAHSTGGLIVPLWLDRRRRRQHVAPVTGVALNSPWFDLQGSAFLRGPGTTVIGALARTKVRDGVLPLPKTDAYGSSLHVSKFGEFEFNVAWKPLQGFGITAGWLHAVRRGHAALHRGLDISVPSLVLRSDASVTARRHRAAVDVADAVLDVRQIARWSGCLSGRTLVVPIPRARHDVFLSQRGPREHAYRELAGWLSWLDGEQPSPPKFVGD